MQSNSKELHGYYFEDLQAGMRAEVDKVMKDSDVDNYANLSGDVNPLHLDEAFASRTRVGGRVVHGMLTASLLSTIVGCKLPGPGCLWMSQALRFVHPVRIGDRVVASGTITELVEEKQRVKMEMQCCVGQVIVVEGEALVWVPRRSSES